MYRLESLSVKGDRWARLQMEHAHAMWTVGKVHKMWGGRLLAGWQWLAASFADWLT
jgi:hypothetical protein